MKTCEKCGTEFMAIGKKEDLERMKLCPECEHEGGPSPTSPAVIVEMDESGRTRVVDQIPRHNPEETQ